MMSDEYGSPEAGRHSSFITHHSSFAPVIHYRRRRHMSILEAPTTRYPDVRNYIGGQFVDASERRMVDITNPADGSVISRVPMSGMTEVDRAVDAARKAFPAWSATPIKERVQVFYRYKALLEQNIDELAALVSEENGKVRNEAAAEVLKSAELCEFATSLPQIVAGEVLEVSRGVECRVERYPVRSEERRVGK